MSDSAPPHKRVGWAELFFDLVFVFAVTEVSTLLREDHRPGGLAGAIIVFVPVYWVWVGTSVQANTADITPPRRQITLFVIALAGLVMALGVPEAYRGRALEFAGAYWAARLVLGSGLLTGTRPTLGVFTVGMVVSGPLLVAGAVVHGPGQQGLWALAAVVDLATPWVLRSRLRDLRMDAAHLAERFGLFVLIAVGESVVSVGATIVGTQALDLPALAVVVAAFAVCCGLWWVYFQYAADAVRHALATAKIQTDITREVLSYGHLLFIAAIIAVAAGLRETVAHPLGRPGWDVTALLFGGAALYLATFGYTRWRMFRQLSTTRLSSAAVVLLLLPAAAEMPALAGLLLLAATLAVLNIIEHRRIHRTASH